MQTAVTLTAVARLEQDENSKSWRDRNISDEDASPLLVNPTLGQLQSRFGLLRIACSLVGALALFSVSGCSSGSGSGSGSGGGGSTPDPYANITGNWQFVATPTSGTAPFTSFSGTIFETAVDAASHSTTATFLPVSTGCYANAGVIPMKGQVEQPAVKLTSFEVLGQYLSITAQKNEAGSAMTGTYSVSGGCADGDKGTITGTFYKALTGTYQGPLASAAAKNIQLSLTQQVLGTSGGTFLLSGSGTFGGFSCFTKGNVSGAGDSYVTGNSAIIILKTDETGAGSTMTVNGTFDPAAATLSVSTIQVTGGSCAGTYGSASLAQS